MQTGKLDKRMGILPRKEEPDGRGGFKTIYEISETVWCELLKPRFVNQVTEGSNAVAITQGIRIRRRAIEEGWRVVVGGRMYSVIHVDDSERGETILTTREVKKGL